MSNNAPDYEDNLVFMPENDQIVGNPEEALKKSDLKLSEEQIRNARVEAAKLIAEAVGAATYELRDQIQIKDMRIRKLKQKIEDLRSASEERKKVIEQIIEELCDPDDDCGLKLAEYFPVELVEKIKEAIQ